jgi:hypothetical protein
MDLREIFWGVQSGSNWLKIGDDGGSCKYSDEPAGSGAMKLVKSLLKVGG